MSLDSLPDGDEEEVDETDLRPSYSSLATIEQSDEIQVYTAGAMLPAIQFRYSNSFLLCLLVQVTSLKSTFLDAGDH